MKKFILSFLLVIFLSSTVCAAPFIVSDPQTKAIGAGFEVYEYTEATMNPLLQPTDKLIIRDVNQTNGSIRFDASPFTVGVHKLKMRYFMDKMPEGIAYSAFVPFDYTKVSLVLDFSPTGIKLVP